MGMGGALLALSFVLGLAGPMAAFAATTPSLGMAGTFGVLSSTFTRNVGLTTITGDLGYTTLSGGGTHTVSGTTHVADATYNQAGTDQGTALTNLNSQACTFTFASGAIDLATDTTHGSIGVYTPGVYCTAAASAASIGTAGITLSGAGTFIFRINGALTSVVNSAVRLSNSASSCDVFWTPTAATTLGANSTFIGTDIDNSGITVGNSALWTGRALDFATTVTTDTATINSTCTTASAAAAAAAAASSGKQDGTITVVKLVINDNGGTKTISDFPLFVNGMPVVSGVGNAFPAPAPAYTITETNNFNYTQTFSGDCDANGQLNLNARSQAFCIITNNDIGSPAVVPPVPPLIDLVKVPSPLALPGGPGPVTYTYTLRNTGTVPVTNITIVGDTCSPINLISGDSNGDSMLDVNEVWTYRCSTTLTSTHTNSAVATGWANGLSTTDIASATVVVGAPIVPPLIHITKIPSPLALLAGGGAVVYTQRVTNPGTVPLSNVHLTDDKCSPIYGPYGDNNGNNLLDSNETWVYACAANLAETTVNVSMATGDANGLTAKDLAVATVVVAAGAPVLGNTGYASDFGAEIRSIAANLALGSIGNNVTILQRFLISENRGSAAAALANVGTSARFGALTRAALVEFQAQVGISPASGNFGPITRAYIRTH